MYEWGPHSALAPGPPLPTLSRGTAILEGWQPTADLPAWSSVGRRPRRAPSMKPCSRASLGVPGWKPGAGLQGHGAEAGNQRHACGVGWFGDIWQGIGAGPVGCLEWEIQGPGHSKEPHLELGP